MPAAELEHGVESHFCVEKPFYSVRARRYSDTDARSTSKRHSMYGHTVRRLCGCAWCLGKSTPTLERSALPVHCRGDHIHSGRDYGADPLPTLAEPYKLTNFELDGLDTSHSLQRDNAWEAIPKILEEHSVTHPSELKLSNGRVQKTYQLAPAGLLMPDPRVAEEHHRSQTNVYEIRRHRPVLLETIPTEAPEQVPSEHPLLKATLSCHGSHVPQTATVRCNQTASYWDVKRANGRPLEIDLGASVHICHFSTQGRHPCLRQWPHVYMDEHNVWQVEDGDYMAGVVPGVRYRGPFYSVRTERTHPCQIPRHAASWNGYHEPSWVGRYELFWRADAGRNWHPLGVFRGNSDEMGEVVHSFTSMQGGGLRARYLRVVPLETVGGGALRVGVYGSASSSKGAMGGSCRRGKGCTRPRGVPMSAAEAGDCLVQYKLTTGGFRSFARDGQGIRSGRAYYYKGLDPKSRRRKAHIEAARLVAQRGDESTFYDPRESDDPLASDDEEEEWSGGSPLLETVAADGGAMADVDGLTLAEREDLQLALALSASLVDHEEPRSRCMTEGEEDERLMLHEDDVDVEEQRMSQATQPLRSDEDSAWCYDEDSSWCSNESLDDDGWEMVQSADLG